MKQAFGFTLLMVAVFLTLRAGYAEPVEDVKLDGIKKIYVAEVAVPPEDSSLVRRCPICNAGLVNTVVLPAGVDMLALNLKRGLVKNSFYEYIFPPKKEERPDEKKFSLDDVFGIASQKGADAALVPVLLRYRELEGNKFAAKNPASVAFHLHLYSTDDKKEIWSFVFNETQRPLSENLLDTVKFWKRRAKWIKAGELLKEGVEKAMKAFPKPEVRKR